MKVIFTTLLLSATVVMHGQLVEVKSKEKLSLSESAYYPVINEDGQKILFTSQNHKGLKIYDVPTQAKSTISEDSGAGYKPVFAENSEEIYYRTNSFVNGRKYSSLKKRNLKQATSEEVVPMTRGLKSPMALKQGVAIASDKSVLRTAKETTPYVSIEDNKIALYQGSNRTELQPCGSDVMGYIRPSISPDGTKLLFHCVGKGTFVSDLKGNVLYSLGSINAPIWYTDNYVVGMLDESADGHDFTASKILISSVDGKFKQDLTTSQEFAMYPTASPETNKIVYNTLSGDIYVLTIDITK